LTASDDERIAYLAGEDVPSLPAEERARLDALRAELGVPAIWEQPPAGLEDQVVMAVTRAAGQRPESEPAVEPAPEPARPADGRRRWRLAMRRPALAFSLSLPVVAAAVVAILLVTSSGKSAPGLQFAMVVQGTALAPGAHGNATLTKTTSGWRIQLSASGLPRRDGKDFYQAWLKNAAGVLVPVGTFNDARKVTLWSGVPVTEFRSLTVTQQVANGDPKSSGRKVLTGTIR
jgi:hypothetical protein